MDLIFNQNLVLKYKSKSQQIRVMTEDWLKNNAYCLLCGNSLNEHQNNNPVGDFYCKFCQENYELKSKQGKSEKIVDGAYSTMIEKIQNNDVPNFFFLNYTSAFRVSNLIIIPKHFFTETIIEKRKPLAQTARRAGWVGCNINLKPIPQSGRIYLINDSIPQKKEEVIKKYNQTVFLKEYNDSEKKGWLLNVMSCVESLGKIEFNLDEMYAFETLLKEKHPNNNNIKPKIRQQLQLLRDADYIEFLGNGKYKLK